MNNRQRKIGLTLIGGIAAAIFFLVMLKKISFAEVVASASLIVWPYFFVALIIYVIANMVRAMRFFLILEKKIPISRIFYIVLVQNALNVIFPMRAGEVSYLHLVHKTGEVSLGKNLASLVSSRIFDLLAILVIFVVAVFSIEAKVPWAYEIAAYVAFALIAAGTWVLIYRGSWAVRLSEYFFRHSSIRAIAWIREKLLETIEGFAVLKSHKILLPTLILSVAGWGLIFLSSFALFVGLKSGLSVSEVAFVYVFPVIVGLTPFFGFGGFGGYEGSIIVPFTMLGVPLSSAFSMGLLLHLQELLFVIILGIVGAIGLWRFRIKDNS